MRTLILGAPVLLLSLNGCARELGNNDNNPVIDGSDLEQFQTPDGAEAVMLSSANVSDCTVLDVNTDGVADGQVIGLSADLDAYGVTPTNPANIYEVAADGTAQYFCIVSGGRPPGTFVDIPDQTHVGECDDTNAGINPDAVDVPLDGIDQDCSGSDATGSASDADVDGYNTDTDCDDTNAAINPGATEVCDSVDNDCDGIIDDGVLVSVFADADGDTYGDPATSVAACSTSSGWVLDSTDCNDALAGINPGATDVPDDGADQDCSGFDATLFGDEDGDGDDSIANGGTDCNDLDAAVHPGATEIANNNKDDGCDGSEIAEIICVTPKTSVLGIAWIPQLSDTTVFPSNTDPNWTVGFGGYVGQACIPNQSIVAGHGWKTQGGFDHDGDGDYGDYSSGSTDFSLGMTDSDNLDITDPSSVTVMGAAVNDLAADLYGTGKDYTFTVPLVLPS